MQVWFVRYTDGGDYEGINSVHKSLESAQLAAVDATAAEKENDGGLSYYVSGPREVLD